ncbi:MAG TPA: hypothetical protein VFO19_08640 [Vicinamibacterales bacterium]|nr:hypothetical protein [Vicinamibacterales bacterium]
MLRNLSAAVCLAAGLSITGCSQPVAPTPAAVTSSAASQLDARGGRAGSIGAVFVSSQGLYYDTFVVKDPLPREGRFQPLENGVTEFGPGDPEYLGGRWWEDLNGNGIQDEGDHFFLCPLLPPGRTTR